MGGIGWWYTGLTQLSSHAHSGSNAAYLGDYNDGEDWLWQTVEFPSDATEATLSFWFDQGSLETYWGLYDYFGVGVYNASWDQVLVGVLLRDGPEMTSGWTQMIYEFSEADLEAVRGQTVHLGFVVVTDYADPTVVWVDDVSLEVCAEGGGPTLAPFRVTLVWTDYPGSLAAARALVNDLDLEIIGPDSTRYRGNAGTSPDRLNTVEDVVITDPREGTYRVVVRAHNVPHGPQPYAVVVTGELGEPPAPTPTPTATSTPTSPPLTTRTATPTATSTSTVPALRTLTPTGTATPSPTGITASTPTATSTPTIGDTPTPTPTSTADHHVFLPLILRVRLVLP
jgi:hypothetical protein